MIQIVGKYQQEKGENIDAYFQSLGLPFIARKMAARSNPQLEITNKDDEWILTTITMLRTQICVFKLGLEYEETMPFGVTLKENELQSVTELEGNSLITISVNGNGFTITRKYDFSEDGLVLVTKIDHKCT